MFHVMLKNFSEYGASEQIKEGVKSVHSKYSYLNKPSSLKEEEVEIKLLEEDKKSDECKENKAISGTETIQVSVQPNASSFADESKSLINEILKRKDKL